MVHKAECAGSSLSRCSRWVDLQVALCQAWVRFEHEHGSAEEHLQAVLKTTPIVERAAAEAMAAANAEAAAIAQACCPAHHLSETARQALLPASHRDRDGGPCPGHRCQLFAGMSRIMAGPETCLWRGLEWRQCVRMVLRALPLACRRPPRRRRSCLPRRSGACVRPKTRTSGRAAPEAMLMLQRLMRPPCPLPPAGCPPSARRPWAFRRDSHGWHQEPMLSCTPPAHLTKSAPLLGDLRCAQLIAVHAPGI